jgi:transcriptional regulator with XRE-family HTH domain
MEEMRRAIGIRLRAARLAAKLTQQDVAKEFGRSRQSMSSWEGGKTLPTVLELRELGMLYGVSSDFLLFGIKSVEADAADALRLVMRKPKKPSEAPASCVRNLPE